MPRFKLSQIGKIIGGGTPSTKEDAYFGGDIPWITPKDLSGYTNVYISRGERNISKTGLSNSSARMLPAGTVLFSSRAPIGYVAIASNEMVTNQGFKSVICNAEVCHNKYLYYWFKLNKDLIESSASGSTFREISGSTLGQIEIDLPDMKKQKQISTILYDFDSKIELNNRMNETLESMAQAIFKHWFVDFEFPNEKGKPYKSSGGKMVKSEMGMIPEGWEVKELAAFSKIIDCLHTKKPEVQVGTKFLLQVYNIKEDGVIDLSEKYTVSDKDYSEWTKNVEVKEGDVIITNAGRVGAIGRIPKGLITGVGRNITTIRCSDGDAIYLFRYLNSDLGKSEIDKNTDSGTILNSLNVKGIKNIKVIIPERKILSTASDFFRNLRNMFENNVKQNQTLSQLRDSLLPRLMSGKMEV